jgi:hypothetical protein
VKIIKKEVGQKGGKARRKSRHKGQRGSKIEEGQNRRESRTKGTKT